MKTFPGLKIGVLIAFGLVACAKDPGAGKPAAEVKPAEKVDPKPLAPAEGGKTEKLTLTTDTSSIKFVGAKVTAQHPGAFKEFTGEIELVGEDPSKSRVMVDIKTDSMVSEETDMDKLIGHLKSPDFFDVAKFPGAKFASTEIKKGSETAGNNHTVTGNLTLRDTTKAITFPAQIDVLGDKVTVKSEFSINRKDFGIVYPGKPDDLIKDNVLIKLDLQAKRDGQLKG